MTNPPSAPYRLGLARRTDNERAYMDELEDAIATSGYSNVEKAMAFPLYTSRQALAQFLFKVGLFQKTLNVHGSVVECGVAYGAGLMTFAHCSAIFEPVNHNRRIIGFDTFAGFPHVAPIDRQGGHEHTEAGGMCVDNYDELQRCIELFDRNRPLGHIGKVELVKGDALKTIPEFMEKNPHLIVSLLYMDFDLYEPTLAALKHFLPRMPKGAILAFDEANHPNWPGETQAILETVGLRNLRLERVPYDTTRSFAVLD